MKTTPALCIPISVPLALRRWMTAALIVLFASFPLTAIRAQTSAVPDYISYQGRVVDASGKNLGEDSSGASAPVNRNIIFRIWDDPSATNEANLIYAEQQVATIAKGEISALIGQGNDLTTNPEKGPTKLKIGAAFGGAARYLGITIDDPAIASDPEIMPRQQIVTAAYAFRAKHAESVGSGGVSTLTAADSGKIGIGNTAPPALLTVSGANSSTTTANPQFLVTAEDVTERLRIGVDSTGNGTGFVQSFKEGSGGQNLLLNPNGGNIGVGTGGVVPVTQLDVNGVIGVFDGGAKLKNAGIASEANGAAISFGVNDSSANLFKGAYSQTDQGGFLRVDSRNSQKLFQFIGRGTGSQPSAEVFGITSAGNVTAAGTISASGISATGNVTATGTISAGPLRATGPVSVVTLGASGDISAARFSTTGNITAGGNVGIGNTDPSLAKLVVTGGPSNTPEAGPYLDRGGGSFNKTTHGSHQFSIYASHGIWTGDFFVASSDARIKAIEGRSDAVRDLATLQGIEVTDFTYIDAVAKASGPQKKVIAQQVEMVFPQAVRRQTYVVPDIYRKAVINDGWVILATDLKKGERVKLLTDKTAAIYEVQEVAKGRFRTDFTVEGALIFVYGREVNDFRVVDYEAIAMLNVSATQQLKKEKDAELQALKHEKNAEMEALRAENAHLRAEFAAQNRRFAVLEAKDRACEARLAGIEHLLRSADKNAARTVVPKKGDAEE